MEIKWFMHLLVFSSGILNVDLIFKDLFWLLCKRLAFTCEYYHSKTNGSTRLINQVKPLGYVFMIRIKFYTYDTLFIQFSLMRDGVVSAHGPVGSTAVTGVSQFYNRGLGNWIAVWIYNFDGICTRCNSICYYFYKFLFRSSVIVKHISALIVRSSVKLFHCVFTLISITISQSVAFRTYFKTLLQWNLVILLQMAWGSITSDFQIQSDS